MIFKICKPPYFICFIYIILLILLESHFVRKKYFNVEAAAAFTNPPLSFSSNRISIIDYRHNLYYTTSAALCWGSLKSNRNYAGYYSGRKSIPIRVRSTTHRGHQQHLGHDDETTSTTCNDRKIPTRGSSANSHTIGRRKLFNTAALSSIGAAAVMTSAVAAGASSELDKKSGEMFVPKKSMLGGGGSDETRGVPLRDRTEGGALSSSYKKKQVLSRSSGELIQTVYETRFIAYLTRFLFNFDPSARAWWDNSDKTLVRFAEFAESVEVGLADYFCGPYGSYASVPAAKAGLTARIPAISSSYTDRNNNQDTTSTTQTMFPNFIEKLYKEGNGNSKSSSSEMKQQNQPRNEEKQGVLNLLALLQARYKSVEAKRQLALLFSMITDPALQPFDQIASLLGEADDASVKSIELSTDAPLSLAGYTNEPLQVIVDPPPALGSEYKVAQANALLRPTSRVLRIRVVDGGEGYTKAPRVTLLPASGNRAKIECQAVATVDREGHVDSIVVLDPGFGYSLIGSKKGPVAPKVFLSHPSQQWQNKQVKPRVATAVAELEYEVYGVNVTEPGNGYVLTQPPRVTIPPPSSEADWSMQIPSDDDIPNAKVTKMESRLPEPSTFEVVDTEVIEKIQSDPTALLPSNIRPTLMSSSTGLGLQKQTLYHILGLPSPPSNGKLLPSPLYAAFDPIFGAVGIAPVTKGAIFLSADQYTRLAVSGAICTIIVRCLLNPLELIKTKIQLENDDELISYARRISTNSSTLHNVDPRKKATAFTSPKNFTEQTGTDSGGLLVLQATTSTADLDEAIIEEDANSKLSTLAVAKSLIALRGPISLFQSSDITFLVSLVLGGLGFGATELFRRAFTSFFFEDGATGMESQLTLLGAAALATIITSLAATPFELTRVRSMGLVERKGWKDVLSDILMSERLQSGGLSKNLHKDNATGNTLLPSISLNALTRDDIKVLFAPFPKIISRELPFAIAKFLTFDIVAKYIEGVVNAGLQLQVQVGVGPQGLAISAFAGAVAGVAGAIVSHPADLILTLSSSTSKKKKGINEETETTGSDWQDIMKDLLKKEGGISNLFAGLLPRSFFFFLVIGSQFFLYDYVKNLLSVGYDDLSLVLDVFYAVRRGLLDE